MAALTISRGLADPYRDQAALLYMEAFRPLLQPLLGDGPRGLDLLARSMNPTHAFAAIRAGQLAGLAGIQDTAGSLLDIGLPAMIRGYGLPGGGLRYLAMVLLLSRSRESGTLLMDGIAVAPECRGQGIGTQLLQAVCEHAREGGYRDLRLDVLDNNPRARALYERTGFVAVKERSYPFLQRFFGFSAVTEMRRPV
ncbi:MAG: GNAT family N-acetyltransferase [Anaerolineaceae bacterium]|nr:GNAT family N-acetyltransferase [Anaerolineaceae bacterium]